MEDYTIENRIYDETNGLWYEQQGDYFIPCLTLSATKEQPIGVWGQRHLRYLKEYHKITYTNILTSGRLNSYLAVVDEQAQEVFLRLVKKMAKREGVTENLKVENQILWIQHMNNIRNRATEIVNVDLIYA